jgi:hypothetical protein
MSEGGHQHDGGMDRQPGFQPGMFPSPDSYQYTADPFLQSTPDPFLQGTPDAFPPDAPGPFPRLPPAYQRSRPGGRVYGRRRYPLRVGSPGWVVASVVRLAVIAFIVYVAFQVFHGAASTP